MVDSRKRALHTLGAVLVGLALLGGSAVAGPPPTAGEPSAPEPRMPVATVSAAPEGLSLRLEDGTGRVLGEWPLPPEPTAEDFSALNLLRSAVGPDEQRLQVAASSDVSFATLMALLDAARTAGFSELSLAVGSE